MKNRYTSISSIFVLTFILALALASVRQLHVDPDNCSGLACSGPLDCGTSCFCNRTVWMCQSSPILQ